ncbi:MAG: hypothetical protein CM1200mP41_18730 [Gammaproteobacteria bacterium]|nr:MAG: hypothetical protein CM1200mP41_18730 [Gammaproteobacteria bacterium]
MVESGHAHHTDAHFGQSTTYQVVYQFNGSDASYHRSVLFSIGELIRKYGEDIEIVVIAIGPGLHILGRSPQRPGRAYDQRKSTVACRLWCPFWRVREHDEKLKLVGKRSLRFCRSGAGRGFKL